MTDVFQLSAVRAYREKKCRAEFKLNRMDQIQIFSPSKMKITRLKISATSDLIIYTVVSHLRIFHLEDEVLFMLQRHH